MEKKISFDEKVFEKLKLIPHGRVTTYKILAQAIQRPRAVRAVGNAVGRNKESPAVPCHRVIRSDGRLGGYSGAGGLKTKIILLQKEGITIRQSKIENFKKHLYNFKVK